MTLTIRRKLFAMAATAAAVVLVLVGVQMWSADQHEATLQVIFEREFRPLVSLQVIEALLKELRFRMAGVLLDQMPIPGSRNQLKEVREQVPAEWKAYLAAADVSTGEERTIVTAIEAGLPTLGAFAAQLDAAYAAEDKKKISSLLEDDWPIVHGKVLKPLAQLLPLANQAVKVRYERARVDGRRQRILLVSVAAVGLLVLVAGAGRVAQGLHRAVRDLRAAMERLAEGDLSAEVQVRSRDELGEVAQLLNTVVGKIRDVMVQVRGAAEETKVASEQLAHAADETWPAGHRGAGLVAGGDGRVAGADHRDGQAERRQRAAGQPARGRRRATLRSRAARSVAPRSRAMGEINASRRGRSRTSSA